MRDVVCITGASRGIGRAAALRFAAEGYSVALLSRRPSPRARETLAEVRALGADGELFFADVAKAEEAEEAFSAVESRFGTPDVLIAAAGVADQRLFQDTSEAVYASIMETNLGGTVRAVRAFLPGMIRRGSGSIVLLSSVWGQVGGSMEAVYSASKAGIIGLTKALAKEVGPSGIRVNAVSPGVIRTDMTSHLGEETLAALAEETPLGRIGTPEDVAEAIFFLASSHASFITGEVLAVGGGFAL